jgi:hypothetical protein
VDTLAVNVQVQHAFGNLPQDVDNNKEIVTCGPVVREKIAEIALGSVHDKQKWVTRLSM